jgi:Domain of unknown function (DUF4382)
MASIRIFLVVTSIIAFAFLLLSCGGGGQNGTVNLSMSDPATCAAPQGPFRHIYVTIADVKIHQSDSAAPDDPGWLDLTKDLSNNPVQVDLLGVSSQCFLAMLGSAGIPAGHYQQLRIILAGDNVTVNNNKCENFANCVMLTNDLSNTPQALQLSSETKTGIKVPSGQMAGGEFTIGAGETKDLNIDFNACASIVVQGTGKYRLKPVLHAGEVATQSTATSISGTIIDGDTQQAIVGGTTIVALEQKDSNGVDRVMMETVAASNGGFAFCPVAAGTYDIVAIAVNGSGNTYAATAITGVQPGNVLGTVPLTPAGLAAAITGQVTTSTGPAGTSADVSLSALQSIGNGTLVTVPLSQQSAATATLTTVPGTCPANTDCAPYTVAVPGMNPAVGAFISGGNQSPTASGSLSGDYTIDAAAFVPGMASESDCSNSPQQTSVTSGNASLTVSPGGSATAHNLEFIGCQ